MPVVSKKIAGNKKIIVKLHPNEKVNKRTAEVKKYLPEALVYHGVSIDPMIANCDTLITRYSSTIFPALALGKEVYSNIMKDLDSDILMDFSSEKNIDLEITGRCKDFEIYKNN